MNDLLTEDTHNVESRTDLHDGRAFGDFDYPDLVTDPADDHFDDWGDTDADDHGSLEECVLVGLLGLEEPTQLPQSLVNSLNHTASHHVSKPKAGKTGLARRLPITEDDFEEGPTRDAYLIVRAQAENLFSKDVRMVKRRPGAIAFFFTSQDNGEDLTFDLCCRVLATRPDVVRLRIVYEFWLRNMQLDKPMPFDTVTMPDLVANEILVDVGQIGIQIAHFVWNWPGVHMDWVETQCGALGYPAKDVRNAMHRMQDAYTLSEHLGGWYLTGRNPIMQNMRDQTRYGGNSVGIMTQTVHWSKLF